MKKKERSASEKRDRLLGMITASPAAILLCVFTVYPVIYLIYRSLFSGSLISAKKEFVGFDNYKSVLCEKEFLQILINTFVYAISTTLFAVFIPLGIAAILNNKIRGAEIFKTIYFLPFITPAVVIAIVWAWIFDPNIGLVNSLLKTNYTWLFDTRLAMPVLIFVSVWKLIGYNVILFLTGFASISPNVYEAAKIDGADEIQIFKNITLPLLKPTTYFVILVTAISSFQVFDLIYVMTSGGPNDATNVIVYSIYKYAFEYFDIGKSCALAYILFVIIFILTLLQRKLAK